MPTFDEVLAGRRMCRDFAPEPVDDNVVDRIVRAALRGPAAGNTDALDLVVLTGAGVDRYWDLTLDPARRAAFPWPRLLCAPVLVLPYVAPRRYLDRYSAPDKSHTGLGASVEDWAVPYWWVDGGAAVMAMLLAAEAADLGALFFGQFDHESAVALGFGVPDDRRSIGTVALGHRGPGTSVSASARRGRPDPVERLHRGGWEGGRRA